MKRLKTNLNKYWIELYFALCIVLAILLCYIFPNALAIKQGLSAGTVVFAAILIKVGINLIGFVNRLRR